LVFLKATICFCPAREIPPPIPRVRARPKGQPFRPLAFSFPWLSHTGFIYALCLVSCFLTACTLVAASPPRIPVLTFSRHRCLRPASRTLFLNPPQGPAELRSEIPIDADRSAVAPSRVPFLSAREMEEFLFTFFQLFPGTLPVVSPQFLPLLGRIFFSISPLSLPRRNFLFRRVSFPGHVDFFPSPVTPSFCFVPLNLLLGFLVATCLKPVPRAGMTRSRFFRSSVPAIPWRFCVYEPLSFPYLPIEDLSSIL